MASFLDSIALRKVSPDVYETTHSPQAMGNAAVRAFGGNTMAAAISAAYEDVPSRYHLYSLLGNFLGPAQIGRKYVCKVRVIRSTKTFITREVEVSQTLGDGKSRSCMIALADFQAAEPASMLVYSKSPSMMYKSPEETPAQDELLQDMVKRKILSQDAVVAHERFFELFRHVIDRRWCPEGFASQVLNGIAKNVPTTQDQLPITSRVSAEWIRMRETLSTPAQHLAALGFVQDGSLAFTPLMHDHKFIPDAGSSGTLEFALRVFTNDFDFNKWYLRELKTITGGVGRTYSESFMWDEQGKMVSSMTQQCILRPHADAPLASKI